MGEGCKVVGKVLTISYKSIGMGVADLEVGQL